VTQPWVVFTVVLGLGVVLGALLGVLLADALRYRRARRRRARARADGHDAVESWIDATPMVWPSRAPRNGSPWDEGHEETTA
jgi:hypothetical protein